MRRSGLAALPAGERLRFYALAAAKIRKQRADDPWTGPNGTARPAQVEPDGNWRTWLLMAGRGFGKTRTGAEWVRERVQSGKARRVALVAPTAADARDVMVEGESGLLAVCERAGMRASYIPSKRRVVFANGSIATLYSSERPRQLRGPQHDTAWAEEIAQWSYPIDTWDQLQFGLRIGIDPRVVVTTTPRPVKLVRNLVDDVARGTVHVTGGTSYENRANLAEAFFDQIIRKYEDTTLGRQELLGELLEDFEGALWNRSMIDDHRVRLDANLKPMMPQLLRAIVAIDPATTHGEDSDETGIAVVGLGSDGHIYVLHVSGWRVSPEEWASKALMLYDQFEADEIVYESNQGGEMVASTIRNACRGVRLMPRVRGVHASRGKTVRAEPTVLLYQKGEVHHVGSFARAEDQMVMFPEATDNDDMVDALVHGVTGLLKNQPGQLRSF